MQNSITCPSRKALNDLICADLPLINYSLGLRKHAVRLIRSPHTSERERRRLSLPRRPHSAPVHD